MAYRSCPHGVVSGQCNACLATQLQYEQDTLVEMARVVRWHSCSWCRHMNRDTVRWCENCGHAAHTPRLKCDCDHCRLRMEEGDPDA